jgi:DNA-binding MarR family transcriptional regulator
MLMLDELPRYEMIQAAAQEIPEVDPSATNAYLRLLYVIGRITSARDTHFARHGISPSRFAVLILLKYYGDDTGLSPAELSKKAGVTPATMTGLVDHLERDGLVRRTQNRQDRRRIDIQLTAAGREFLGRILPDYSLRISGLMANLSEEERHMLAKLLDKVEAGLSALIDP